MAWGTAAWQRACSLLQPRPAMAEAERLPSPKSVWSVPNDDHQFTTPRPSPRPVNGRQAERFADARRQPHRTCQLLGFARTLTTSRVLHSTPCPRTDTDANKGGVRWSGLPVSRLLPSQVLFIKSVEQCFSLTINQPEQYFSAKF